MGVEFLLRDPREPHGTHLRIGCWPQERAARPSEPREVHTKLVRQDQLALSHPTNNPSQD